VELNVMVGIVGVVVGMVISYVTFLRNRTKDDTEEGARNGVMMAEIGYIKAGIDDIKAEQREQRKAIDSLSSRMARVEESAKSAHKRIDNLENGGGT